MTSIIPPSEGQFLVSRDGTKIWADVAGNPNKPAVVFIHGLSCTALAFDSQFSDPSLLNNLYMVRYDMRGHGRSDHPQDFESYSSIKFAEDFMIVCSVFGLKKPFICGWSMGALVPVDVIEAYGADLLSGVLLPGGPMITRSLHHDYIHDHMKDRLTRFLVPSADEQAQAAIEFAESCVADPKTLPFETKMKWVGGYSIQSPSVRRHVIARTQNSSRWEKEIQNVPVQIIQGELDIHSATDKMVPIAKKYFPRLELHILKGCGHAPCFERAEETNRLILEFVQKHSMDRLHKL